MAEENFLGPLWDLGLELYALYRVTVSNEKLMQDETLCLLAKHSIQDAVIYFKKYYIVENIKYVLKPCMLEKNNRLAC